MCQQTKANILDGHEQISLQAHRCTYRDTMNVSRWGTSFVCGGAFRFDAHFLFSVLRALGLELGLARNLAARTLSKVMFRGHLEKILESIRSKSYTSQVLVRERGN